MTSISKYLAQAGYCSRRKAVEVVLQETVTVNGVVVKHPAFLVPEKAMVKVGKKLIQNQQKYYLMLNKPKGYITTVSDEKGRNTVMDLVVDAPKVRLYPIGRLDQDSTGLLLLTNDGICAQTLSHPKYEISKTYVVTLDKALTQEHADMIRKGVRLEDGLVSVDILEVVHPRTPEKVKVTLHSGKNRVLRRLFDHLGYFVTSLDRVAYAGLSKRELPRGRWRFLKKHEIERLMKK